VPINPCGMGMDLLRSCYSTKMRFFLDSDVEVPVRWFFCDDKAKIFPAHHLFGSGNWAKEKTGWPGPGEVEGEPRPWSPGAIVAGFKGQHFCGPLAGFTEGTNFPGIPLHADKDGNCACCTPTIPTCQTWPHTPHLWVNLISVVSSKSPPYGPVRTSIPLNYIPVIDQWGTDFIVPRYGIEVFKFYLICSGAAWRFGSSNTTLFTYPDSISVTPIWDFRAYAWDLAIYGTPLPPHEFETWHFTITDHPVFP
jgi:hypothetical protein